MAKTDDIDLIYRNTESLVDNTNAIYEKLDGLNRDFHDYDFGAANYFQRILINTRWIIILLVVLIIAVLSI